MLFESAAGDNVRRAMLLLRSGWPWHFLLSGVVAFCSMSCKLVFGLQEESSAVLISAGSQWRYLATKHKPAENWYRLEFDDTSWPQGASGFGYGDDDDRTQIEGMRGHLDSMRIRHDFTLDTLRGVKKLYLYMRYDDAFIAYLNGTEILRSGVIERDGRQIVESHEARYFEEFSLSKAHKLLKKGVNTLAIVGFNRSRDSSDFSLHPVLTRKAVNNPQLPASLTVNERLQDVDYLLWRLEDQSSYLQLQRSDYRHDFSQIRRAIEQPLSPLNFAALLHKGIMKIGDAHAGVDVDFNAEGNRYLPILVADSSAGLLAIKTGSSSFLERDYPVLVAIDGRPIDYWLELASQYSPQASPQLVRYKAIRHLKSIDRLRQDAGDIPTTLIDITVQSFDGKRQLRRRLRTSYWRLSNASVAMGDSRLMDNNIGYLRIAKMKEDAVDEVVGYLMRLSESDGLIIDVRGNRGGRYHILRALYGFFVAEDAPDYVSNIAAYKLSSRFDEEHLHYRPTYRLQYDDWSAAQRRAIVDVIPRFKPEWRLPAGEFSDWHYMVLGKLPGANQFHYQKPVVVLCDAASFSATDGFLSAFAELPNVVLMGQASGGGSGATQSFSLPHSGVDIALSSMASFRPNGLLFDGRGIDVDITVLPAASDFISDSDAVLERGQQWIIQRRTTLSSR